MSIVIPRRFSSSRRSASMPVRAFTSEVLPWSICPAVPTMTDFICDSIDGGLGRTLLSAAFAVLLKNEDQRQRQEQRTGVSAPHELIATSSGGAKAAPVFRTLLRGRYIPAVRALAHRDCRAKGQQNRHARRASPMFHDRRRERSNSFLNSRAAPTTTMTDVRSARAAS